MTQKITKLAIFDFDGTLVDTPLKEAGSIIFEQKTGQKWPHKGWWGREDTLSLDIFDIPVVPQVIEAYNKEKENPSTALVMLTGRRENLRPQVMKILEHHGLEFHEYHLNRFGATEVDKMRRMEKLLVKYPEVRQIELWDDRLEHIPIFDAFGQRLVSEGQIDSFVINVVPADRH